MTYLSRKSCFIFCVSIAATTHIIAMEEGSRPRRDIYHSHDAGLSYEYARHGAGMPPSVASDDDVEAARVRTPLAPDIRERILDVMKFFCPDIIVFSHTKIDDMLLSVLRALADIFLADSTTFNHKFVRNIARFTLFHHNNKYDLAYYLLALQHLPDGVSRETLVKCLELWIATSHESDTNSEASTKTV